MGSFTSFKTDVFISYSHVDNRPELEEPEGWVAKFHALLAQRLWKKAGREVNVWWDPRLYYSERFDDRIEDTVRNSAIVLALLSPSFLTSRYCQKELEWFRQAVDQVPSASTSTHSRVFPILLYNLPKAAWPDTCRGITGFSFHEGQRDDVGDPLDPASVAFKDMVKRLATEILLVLNGFQPAPLSEPSLKQAGLSKGKVFLGFAADDLRSTRRRIAKKLETEGYEIFPAIPPPEAKPAHDEALRNVLGRADLAIHLLGQFPGRPFQDDRPEEVYAVEQVRLGFDAPASQLILLPDHLDTKNVEESFYGEFLNGLIEQDRHEGHLELARISKVRMADHVLTRLIEMEDLRKRHQAADARAVAFIDIHEADLQYASNILSYLLEHNITPVTIPSTDATLDTGLAGFRKSLMKARLYIAVYGDVARDWVQRRCESAIKLIVEEHLDMKVGVFLAPPRKSPQETKFSSLFSVVDSTNVFNRGAFDQFLNPQGATS